MNTITRELQTDIGRIKICFWIYLFLVFFEGAFRKWLLPSLADIFLVIRDPFALYVIIIGIKKRMLTDFFVISLIIVSLVSFCLTLILGHQNLIVAIYGLRITLIHIPSIFIFGKVLSRNDLWTIGRFTLYSMIGMTGIIAAQYFSPQSSFINIGVGGEGSSGFSGVADYFRPSGAFSFIAGMVAFEFLAGVFLFYFIVENKRLPKKFQFSRLHLIILMIIYIISTFICLSRSVIFQSLLLVFALAVSPFLINRGYRQTFTLIFVIAGFFILLLNLDFFRLGVENMLTRFNNASNSEGNIVEGTIGERYFGSFIRALTEPQNFQQTEVPFWGYGLGMGTNVGARMMGIPGFALAEEEWSRIVDEMGLLLGGTVLIGFRLIWSLKLSLLALKKFINNRDYLPYLLSPFFLIFMLSRQWALPTFLGFCVIVGSLQIAAIRTSDNSMFKK